jgi:phosphoenolpyruvate synthase/pyruvate phosphate dikinase
MEKKSEFGGKGTGLLWLTQNIDLGFVVPKFEIIDTSYYEDVLKQHEIAKISAIIMTRATGQQHVGQVLRVPRRLEERCIELANTFNGKGVAIRSSAVISEDSDRFSGAGIYDSFFLESYELTPRSLQEAVLKVYGSVNNDRAVQYRKDTGLGNEQMAVVVQELAEGDNGVVMSRLPARAGIMPISWSEERGEVVKGSNEAKVHTLYFEIKGDKVGDELFVSDTGISFTKWESYMKHEFAPVILKLRERYGWELEGEFSIDLENKRISMLQIRPLTNIQNVNIEFPKKESIFDAKICMGVGEYIGQWFIPEKIKEGWDEPQHYVYVSARLDQTIPKSLAGLSFISRDKTPRDYDKLTPNKKAIVLTKNASPIQHALTIANERGLICVIGNMKDELSDEEFEREHGYTKSDLEDLGPEGRAILSRPTFKVPINEIGDYIHVVSDGLRGYVYRATEKEAREFTKRMTSQVDYKVSSLEGSDFEQGFFDWQFTVIPSDLSLCGPLCKDFVKHLERVSGKRFRLKVSLAKNYYDLHSSGAEFEVYSAMFDPEKKEEGINFTTGRSAYAIADKETTRKWFEEFRSKLKRGYIPSEE